MKKTISGFIAVVAVVGLFQATSLLHADQSIFSGEAPAGSIFSEETAGAGNRQDEAAWDAWRTDFESVLQADEAYQAAEAALAAYEGDDETEYGRLTGVRDNRYRNLARVVYEQHFGEWVGTDDEFDELVERVMGRAIVACTEAAVKGCGKGNVCWVISDGDKCVYACRDSSGVCPPMPVP